MIMRRVALEIPYIIDASYPQVLRDYWGSSDLKIILKKLKSDFDFLSIKFNIDEFILNNDIEKIIGFVKFLNNNIDTPLIIRGANNTEIDRRLLPILSDTVRKNSVIAFADEFTYEAIIPSVIKNQHTLVLRSPIDINLAKELNILSLDKGLSQNKILIDPDMGGLGYGIEYGYSIIERIKQAASEGDKMLDMPIIGFIGEETYRAKEAKSDKFNENWGNYTERARLWELSAASAIAAAGADIIVLWHPENVKVLKETLWN